MSLWSLTQPYRLNDDASDYVTKHSNEVGLGRHLIQQCH